MASRDEQRSDASNKAPGRKAPARPAAGKPAPHKPAAGKPAAGSVPRAKGKRPAVAARGRNEGGPGVPEIEELFWRSGLDLLVDGRKMFLGVEFVEVLQATESPTLVALPDGRFELTVGGQLFELGPYSEHVDGHALRWLAKASARPAAGPGAGAPPAAAVGPSDEDDDDEDDDEDDTAGEGARG